MARNQKEAQREASEARPIMSSGVGESRTFNAPEGTYPDEIDNPRHPRNCTLNGNPIPEGLWGMIPYEMTDQGHAEKHEGKEHACCSITVDEVHQSIRRRGGDLEADMGDFAFDPMLELAREHVPPGMRPKFLSKRKVDAEGTTRGYRICRKENGDPVSLGTSILGYMPEERAAAIQQSFEAKSHEAQREMYGEDFDPHAPGRERVFEKFREQDKLTRGQGPSRLSEDRDPSDSDFGLSQSEGEEFQL